MTRPEAHLLSPYRPPTSYPSSVSAAEATAWLAGYFALWHPAVLRRIGKPPAVSSVYDHDQPADGFVYAVAESPAVFQPDDWPDRVREANAIRVVATPDRQAVMADLREAMGDGEEAARLFAAPADVVQAFAGLGYGYLVVDTLFEAASHDRLLDADGFWADVSAAVQAVLNPDDASGIWTHLKAAAEKLKTAREGLSTNPLHLLDWAILEPGKPVAEWPESLRRGLPCTVLASGESLDRLSADQPDRFAELRSKFLPNLPSAVDLTTGAYSEREDALLPPESQWWNMAKARATAQRLLGADAAVYGRAKSANHPQVPGWALHCGFKHATLLSLDGATVPHRSGPVATWPGPDGRSVDAYARDPIPAAEPATFFNLPYTLHTAINQDSNPTVAFAHRGEPAAIGYAELVALSELAGVLGEFTSVGRYLGEHHYGDYLGTATADDFFSDSLDERVTARKRPDPVSGFAVHQRLRRRLDGAFSLAALYRMLTPEQPGEADAVRELTAIEDEIEAQGADNGRQTWEGEAPAEPGSAWQRPGATPVGATGVTAADALGSPARQEPRPPTEGRLHAAESAWAKRLADRLQARSQAGQPGWLVFNPCGFARRVGLEFPGLPGPIPAADPVKASEFADGTARVVVEVPALGYAWLARPTQPGPAPKPRIKTAEGAVVRNEFFEAELDPATGGLRAFRDTRTRLNRLGLLPVFNPGSTPRARSVAVTHAGAALGEVTADGDLLDEHGRVLATFRHRLRAWVGRPALELSLEFDLKHPPTGYPWHAYYAARLGWRDDRAALFRGVSGANTQTHYTRPGSPDYLEVRLGKERTFVFTGGLPFAQKQTGRILDLVLIPEGEASRRFDLLIAADRDYPMQTAAGWTAPAPVVATDKGPPGGMASSWLAHLDLPSLLLTSLRPGEGRTVTARLLETAGFGGAADLRFAVPPARAELIDGEGTHLKDVLLNDGVIPLEFSANEVVRVKCDWT
ncbi:MAG: hypothetical protein U0871_02870 [Gemmataceae bacterium]